MRVIWSPAALREVDEIFNFILLDNAGAALDVAETIIAAGNSLSILPSRGRIVPGTTMRELVLRLPYIIRYRVKTDQVRILRVRHTSRRPTKP